MFVCKPLKQPNAQKVLAVEMLSKAHLCSLSKSVCVSKRIIVTFSFRAEFYVTVHQIVLCRTRKQLCYFLLFNAAHSQERLLEFAVGCAEQLNDLFAILLL